MNNSFICFFYLQGFNLIYIYLIFFPSSKGTLFVWDLARVRDKEIAVICLIYAVAANHIIKRKGFKGDQIEKKYKNKEREKSL